LDYCVGWIAFGIVYDGLLFGIVSDGFDRWIAFGIIYDGLCLGLFMIDLIDRLRLGLLLMVLLDGCDRRLIFEFLCWVDYVWDCLR
jgi:hypothetical protein